MEIMYYIYFSHIQYSHIHSSTHFTNTVKCGHCLSQSMSMHVSVITHLHLYEA